MPKFEVEMEITGFKLKVKGEREDIRTIAANLQSQLPRLIEGPLNIPQGNLPERTTLVVEPNNGERQHSKSARARRTPRTANGEARSAAADWSHDPSKWGIPRQSWSASLKILWLLRVATSELGTKEMSGPAIAATFNKHFRQARALNSRSMSRDLGTLKQRTPSALVSDDATQSPIVWFLTEEGIKEADKLIAEATSTGVST